MELNANKHLWGEMDDIQHAANPSPAVTIKPATHVTCHVPTLEVSSTTEDSTNQ